MNIIHSLITMHLLHSHSVIKSTKRDLFMHFWNIYESEILELHFNYPQKYKMNNYDRAAFTQYEFSTFVSHQLCVKAKNSNVWFYFKYYSSVLSMKCISLVINSEKNIS